MAEPDDVLGGLACGIARSGLRAPAALLLDLLSPLDVISCQAARFGRPFVGGTGLAPVLAALEEPAAWAELRRRLERQD